MNELISIMMDTVLRQNIVLYLCWSCLALSLVNCYYRTYRKNSCH